MDGFYNFFKAYQERSQGDPIKKQEAENYLQDYRLGGLKATRQMPEGTLKCIGVWDTVGALGIRKWSSFLSSLSFSHPGTKNRKKLKLMCSWLSTQYSVWRIDYMKRVAWSVRKIYWGLLMRYSDQKCITHFMPLVIVYPLLESFFFFLNQEWDQHWSWLWSLWTKAIDETRLDFLPTKWTQTEEARQAGQVMKQVWFSGAHSDVGGGYTEHDLSDLTLVWMVVSSETPEMRCPYVYSTWWSMWAGCLC